MDTYVGDTIQFIINTGIDISGYSTKCIKYRKPDGTVGTWAAAINPTNSKQMIYTCDTEDLDQAGKWVIQASVEEAAQQLNGRWIRFDVHEPLREACSATTAAPTTAP